MTPDFRQLRSEYFFAALKVQAQPMKMHSTMVMRSGER
jgi:hypothetical protein